MEQSKYNALDGERWTRLKAMAVSPMYYLFRRDNPPASTAALTLGAASHCLILEGAEEFGAHYIAEPDFGNLRTKAARENRDTWRESNSGRTILTAEQAATCECMSAAVSVHPRAAELVSALEPEIAYQWEDSETGIACKAMSDGVIFNERLVSLKSTRATDPETFGRHFFNLGYHGGSAFYIDGYHAAHGQELPETVIAVQSVPPYDVWVFDLPPVVIDEGRGMYGRLLEQLDHCRKSNQWPGAVPLSADLPIPAWAIHAETENDLSDLGLEGL